jgi:hypothetical protein
VKHVLYPIFIKGVNDLAIPVTTPYKAPVVTAASKQNAIAAEIARKAAAGIPLAGDQNGNVSTANAAAYKAAIATPAKITNPVVKSASVAAPAPKTPEIHSPLGNPAVKTAVPDPVYTPSYSSQNSYDDVGSQIQDALNGLDLQGMFSGITSQYDDKFSALQRLMEEQNATSKTQYDTQTAAMQKQYDELMNKYKYSTAQVNPNSVNNNAQDGIQVYDPSVTPTDGSAQIGASQPNEVNNALYRYLNQMWGGGF